MSSPYKTSFKTPVKKSIRSQFIEQENSKRNIEISKKNDNFNKSKSNFKQNENNKEYMKARSLTPQPQKNKIILNTPLLERSIANSYTCKRSLTPNARQEFFLLNYKLLFFYKNYKN